MPPPFKNQSPRYLDPDQDKKLVTAVAAKEAQVDIYLILILMFIFYTFSAMYAPLNEKDGPLKFPDGPILRQVVNRKSYN